MKPVNLKLKEYKIDDLMENLALILVKTKWWEWTTFEKPDKQYSKYYTRLLEDFKLNLFKKLNTRMITEIHIKITELRVLNQKFGLFDNGFISLLIYKLNEICVDFEKHERKT